MILYGDQESNSYFFVHPFSVTQDVPSRFGLIEVKQADYSLLKIPLEFISPDLRESVRNQEEEPVSLEEYIRTFKLGNIKNKKRVFMLTEPIGAEEPAREAVSLDNPLGKVGMMPLNASSLFE